MKALDDLDVWLAVYFSPRRIEPVPVFENVTMWQWTSSDVSIPGINADVDCNFAYKDYAVPLKGDLNGDGEVDSVDILLEKKYLIGNLALTDEQKKLADLNGDGDVDSTDYLLLSRKIVAVVK